MDTYKLYSQGKLASIVIMDSLGRKQGTFKNYSYGILSQTGNYLDNKFHGEFVLYHENGNKKQIYYYDKGEETGRWIYLSELGDTIKTEDYNEITTANNAS